MFKVLNSCFLSVDLFCKWLFFFLGPRPTRTCWSRAWWNWRWSRISSRCALLLVARLLSMIMLILARIVCFTSFLRVLNYVFCRAACQHTWPRVFFRRRKWSQSCCANLAAHLIVHLPYILPYIFLFNSICFRSCRAPFILSVMNYHNAFRVDHHAAFHVEHFPR